MSEYDNSGILFVNEDHEQGDNRPSLKGKATVGGVEYKLALWRKPGKPGKADFFTLKFEPKEEPVSEPPADEEPFM